MGSEQHYSLRWNDYTVKIVTAFQSLRDEEDFVDVTVACDGHSYLAHKMVLSACSPYFRALLRANPCQHPIVILKDVGHVELERLLEFMYNGEVSIAQDQLAAFLRTAENLKIRGLAGSSDDMDQLGLQRPDVSYSYSSCSMGGGGVGGGGASGRSSPSAGYAPSQGSKDEEVGGDGYHTRAESPPSKRRKRPSAPAAGHADSNTATHTSEGGVVGDASVEIESSGSVSGAMPGEDDVRLDRRELKSEPALPGPSGAAGNQDTIGPHEPGAAAAAAAVAAVAVYGRRHHQLNAPQRRQRQQHPKPEHHHHHLLHQQEEDSRNVECHVCGKSFLCKDSLRRHFKLHLGTALQCPACEKLFVQKGDLNRHIRRRHPHLADTLPSSSSKGK